MTPTRERRGLEAPHVGRCAALAWLRETAPIRVEIDAY
jgi:hypothetical protein